jgi:hypothetical protein
MPNWCHNTVTVRGEGQAKALAAFVKKVAADDRPLSFATLVPEPTAEEYAAMDEKNMVECNICGGTGYRARTEDEALRIGGIWVENIVDADAPDDQRLACNGCSDHDKPREPGIPGTGRKINGTGAWYEWRCSNWGTKWDASFDGPFMALGAEGTDLEASVASQGSTQTPEIVIYKFDTAWGPPEPFVQRASELYPEFEFELQFGEAGNGFAGYVIYKAGEQTEGEDMDIEDVLAPEEMWF